MEDVMKMFNLKDKVAIVTGGYGYLGKAMVESLLDLNAIVVVAGRSKSKFDQTFRLSLDRHIVFKRVDITDSKSISQCMQAVNEEYGKIDILVNNAHAARGNSQEKMSDEDWSYTMEGVVGSVHKSIRSVIPFMKKQRVGKIVNIASMYGVVSPDFDNLYKGGDCEKYANPPHYGAAKAAMIQLTKYYAVLLGHDNIHINAISPGPFPKDGIQKENPEFIKRLKSKNPLQKIGNPNDLKGVIALLTSSASDFITGQNIQVDGGWTIW